MEKTVLVTGAAGFIGSHLSQRLIAEGYRVVGFDNFCDFYPRPIKENNIAQLSTNKSFILVEGDLRDGVAVDESFAKHSPDFVVHLAAMAGVRPSIAAPKLYTEVNLDGTVNILQASVKYGVTRMLFASSSSVYGNNTKVPFAESDPVNDPISPYAATKRAGELLCHTYWYLNDLPIFCLRFFTVFGPRQRPDLAISKFLKLIRDEQPIPMFGDGSTSRDYTYIDDIIAGIIAALDQCDRFGIYNLGGSHPVTLKQLIQTCSEVVGKKPIIEKRPMQPGDVNQTYADMSLSQKELGFNAKVSLADGIAKQWQWMKEPDTISKT